MEEKLSDDYLKGWADGKREFIEKRNTEVKQAINELIEVRKKSINQNVSIYYELFSINDLQSILQRLGLDANDSVSALGEKNG